MSQVLDYAWSRPDPAAIKSKYIGVMRYLAPLPNGKVIDVAEYKGLEAAGLQIGLNWESYANRTREGASAGRSDAQEALRQANALAYTGAIYFSIDYDAPESDQGALDEYFKACAQVLGLARLGAYAGYWPLKRLFDAGLITFGWQTVAWSGGLKESRAHLFQTGKQDFGGQADSNDVLRDTWTGGVTVPPVDYRAQQAKDVWQSQTTPICPTNTGIHAAWLAAYEKGIILGVPLDLEYKTVDWAGNAIVRQEFSGGWIEYYVDAGAGYPAGSNHGYSMAGTTLVTLW